MAICTCILRIKNLPLESEQLHFKGSVPWTTSLTLSIHCRNMVLCYIWLSVDIGLVSDHCWGRAQPPPSARRPRQILDWGGREGGMDAIMPFLFHIISAYQARTSPDQLFPPLFLSILSVCVCVCLRKRSQHTGIGNSLTNKVRFSPGWIPWSTALLMHS